MSYGGDFVPSGETADTPDFPKLFGLSLTPTVNGVLVALVGLVGAYLLFSSLVQPALQRNQELSQDIATKEAQRQNLELFKKQIEDARLRLKDAEQLRADVLSLFASEKSVDTLLLDVNERVQSVNAGITDPDQRATLSKFDLDAEASGPVVDGSLGSEVNNRLERRVYQVEIKGSYPQTQSIIRNIERLQPLLVISNFKTDLDSSTQEVLFSDQGRLLGQPVTRITTGFQLAALVPIEQSVAPAASIPAVNAPPGTAPAAPPSPAPSP
ncbi:MAG: pilus assembly protein PilO [Leptolyngbyaceae cyanobacterium CSU_1_4]|nr:pilus assembly protein PilO [Leptolyngbyaceae cyanobacterium CSU_1_4]